MRMSLGLVLTSVWFLTLLAHPVEAGSIVTLASFSTSQDSSPLYSPNSDEPLDYNPPELLAAFQTKLVVSVPASAKTIILSRDGRVNNIMKWGSHDGVPYPTAFSFSTDRSSLRAVTGNRIWVLDVDSNDLFSADGKIIGQSGTFPLETGKLAERTNELVFPNEIVNLPERLRYWQRSKNFLVGSSEFRGFVKYRLDPTGTKKGDKSLLVAKQVDQVRVPSMKLTRVTTDDPVIGYSTIREWVPQAPVISEDLRVFFGAEKLDQFEINEIVFAQ